MKKVFAATGMLVCIAGAAAVPAMARTHVDVHIGVGVPGVYVHPAPVYQHPQPVYVQPYPVYVYPAPVYVHPPHSHWHKPHGIINNQPFSTGHHPYGNPYRNGVPNRWDHRPHNHYRH